MPRSACGSGFGSGPGTSAGSRVLFAATILIQTLAPARLPGGSPGDPPDRGQPLSSRMRSSKPFARPDKARNGPTSHGGRVDLYMLFAVLHRPRPGGPGRAPCMAAPPWADPGDVPERAGRRDSQRRDGGWRPAAWAGIAHVSLCGGQARLFDLPCSDCQAVTMRLPPPSTLERKVLERVCAPDECAPCLSTSSRPRRLGHADLRNVRRSHARGSRRRATTRERSARWP